MYLIIKNIHIVAAMTSIAGFVLRGVWMIRGSSMLERKLVRVLPHIIDTVLLVSAIWLSILLAQYPFVAGWLTAKLIALIIYIVLGMIALRRGKTRRQRIVAFSFAVLAFVYILLVAVFKTPMPTHMF